MNFCYAKRPMRLLYFVCKIDNVKWHFFVFAKVGNVDFRVMVKYSEIKKVLSAVRSLCLSKSLLVRNFFII